MPAERSTRLLDVTTAVMLGLVSVVTALGAWQAAAWDSRAQELERDSGDARDVSVNQSVLADYTARADIEASATARVLSDQLATTDDVFEQLVIDTRIQATLGTTTPGFSELWRGWQEAGFDPAADPLADPDYLVLRDGRHESYAFAGEVLDEMSNALEDRSSVLAQAALIQALALFLFGIAGVNRVPAVRIGVIGLGTTVFIGGLVLALTSFGAGG